MESTSILDHPALCHAWRLTSKQTEAAENGTVREKKPPASMKGEVFVYRFGRAAGIIQIFFRISESCAKCLRSSSIIASMDFWSSALTKAFSSV